MIYPHLSSCLHCVWAVTFCDVWLLQDFFNHDCAKMETWISPWTMPFTQNSEIFWSFWMFHIRLCIIKFVFFSTFRYWQYHIVKPMAGFWTQTNFHLTDLSAAALTFEFDYFGAVKILALCRYEVLWSPLKEIANWAYLTQRTKIYLLCPLDLMFHLLLYELCFKVSNFWRRIYKTHGVSISQPVRNQLETKIILKNRTRETKSIS